MSELAVLPPAYVALLHDSSLLPFRADAATIKQLRGDWNDKIETVSYAVFDDAGAPFTLFLRLSDVSAITHGQLRLLFYARAPGDKSSKSFTASALLHLVHKTPAEPGYTPADRSADNTDLLRIEEDRIPTGTAL